MRYKKRSPLLNPCRKMNLLLNLNLSQRILLNSCRLLFLRLKKTLIPKTKMKNLV